MVMKAGWILMPELMTAFHVLGMDVKQAEVNAIMAEASPVGNTHMVLAPSWPWFATKL